MSSWNDLIFSQTMISKTEMQTIPTALIMFNGSYGQVDWGPLFAAMAIAVVPTLVLYMFLSKFMIRGLTAGAIKRINHTFRTYRSKKAMKKLFAPVLV